ncbi:cytochrome c oxidase subunit II [Blastopirellula sp. JC732]|uniref:Cytochrome c oxidase subunit 2 n=1 Tax=Blastopirellula sediminis TaxID=2894196 RepID=A0A9X1SIZ7_9BACT|nr:cytochrome c oxidase subunit II [Blastopirellula sediminis]MCC9605354.1 cytochrome c oxidase subunit II [Blastopirellula sediminis]MCC9631346.1 cytochrome c oxidase subunit II [Blastopirellula sediminis]
MGRVWSILFLTVPILGVWTFVAAMNDWWPMSEGAFGPGQWFPALDVSNHVIDHLFYLILYLTGAVFIGTGLVLFWFLWRYDAATNKDPVVFSHGSHALEVVWSILPAVVLLFIAIYQMDAWANARMRRPLTAEGAVKPPLCRVSGRQFEWRIQYPGEDGRLDTPDDLHVLNDLYVPVNEEVVIEIESLDVLHSFFLPNMRVKQDVVPGMRQYVWFHPVKEGVSDIVCAELCGWGHYKMRGQISVVNAAEYDRWFSAAYAAQETSAYDPAEEEE